MNSSTFIKSYLEKNNYERTPNLKKVFIYVFIMLVISILIYTFNPFENLRNIAIKNFENYNKSTYPSLNYKNISEDIYTSYSLPIEGTITSDYGMRIDPITGKYAKHTGIDISGEHHARVKAFEDGIITYSGVQSGYGNCVEIMHQIQGKKIYSFYAHLSKINVEKDQFILKNKIIGLEGGANTDPNPGNSTGHHLHFELRNASGFGNDIDPFNYISKK